MSKIPISLKLMIGIGIGIGIGIMLTSLYFLQDHPYYHWIRWTGNILFIAGIVLIPFAKESNKSNVKTR